MIVMTLRCKHPSDGLMLGSNRWHLSLKAESASSEWQEGKRQSWKRRIYSPS